MRLLLIADDLTGALDSAAAFAVRGLAVRVATGPEHLAEALMAPAAQIVSVATGTREMDSVTAAGVIRSMSADIRAFDGLLFKKVDSRLKGNIAAELAVLGDLRPGPILACPAIPRLGRFVRNAEVTGSGVATGIPVAPCLGRPATIADAQSDADLDAALPEDLSGTLYLGAAGLAESLARRLAPQGAGPRHIALTLPLLLAIGSRDPITLAQIAALDIAVTQAPDGRILDRPHGDPVRVVQMTPGSGAGGSPDAGTVFARDLVRDMRRDRPATLFACGGETAATLLRGLDIAQLDLLGEVLAGVPVARCPASGMTVITKSGGFGEAALLKQLVKLFAKPGQTSITGAETPTPGEP